VPSRLHSGGKEFYALAAGRRKAVKQFQGQLFFTLSIDRGLRPLYFQIAPGASATRTRGRRFSVRPAKFIISSDVEMRFRHAGHDLSSSRAGGGFGAGLGLARPFEGPSTTGKGRLTLEVSAVIPVRLPALEENTAQPDKHEQLGAIQIEKV